MVGNEICPYCDEYRNCPHCGRKIGLLRRFVKWVDRRIYDAVDIVQLLLATGSTFLLICVGIWVLKDAGVI